MRDTTFEELADTSIRTQRLICFEDYYDESDLQEDDEDDEFAAGLAAVNERVYNDPRCSRPLVFVCNTQLEVEVFPRGGETYDRAIEGIKNVLQIRALRHDDALRKLLDCSNGGHLRIFFMSNPSTFMPLNRGMKSADITFSGKVQVGVTGYTNGTGGVIQLPITFTLPLTFDDSRPIRVETLIKHNYTESACMSWSWCKSTQFELSNIVYNN